MKKKNAGILGTLLMIAVSILSILFGTDLLKEFGLSDDMSFVIPTQPANGGIGTEPQDWYEIYFSNPTCPPVEERSGGLDEIVADHLLGAEVRVDVAAFDLDAAPIVDALIALEERGVQVRVVTDADNGDLSSIRRLRRHGTSVVEDERSALMHNKFIVVDGRYLWVGSMNFTSNGAYCNNNNLVFFDSPRLANNYTSEMDEMVENRNFGPNSPVNTANEQLTIQGSRVENYFGPEKEIAPVIARTVAGAEESILFMAFSFTDERVGEAILGRADAGVPVQGVFEATGSTTDYSYYPPMRDALLSNLQVRQDNNPHIMHHKVIIIDWETVVFGSFNFSENANSRNDENILIVHDPTFAAFFVEEFGVVWEESLE